MFSEREDSHQSIDNAELQGIMEEIENLENDFSDEQELASLENSKSMQNDRELQEDDGRESLKDILMREAEKEKAKTADHSAQAQVPQNVLQAQTNAQGKDADFEMSFPIGKKRVQLTVRPGQTLSINLNGVQLNINEENCSISLEAGVSFAIPHNEKKGVAKAA